MNLALNQFRQIYQVYYRVPFYSFTRNIRHLVYSRAPFDPVRMEARGWEWLLNYIEFLLDEGIIGVDKKRDRFYLRDKDLGLLLPSPVSEDTIKERIEKRLKKNLKRNHLVTDLFEDIYPFSPEPAFDQGPVSLESAIFIVKKILDHIPMAGRFLFIGDDDLISLILSIVEPQIRPVVIDIDRKLLEGIDRIAGRYNIPVTTGVRDVRKEPLRGYNFTGFHTHPPYIESAVKKFVDFGIKHIGMDGGLVSLAIGDLALGNRYLYLQRFFASRQLLIRECLKGAIYYPCKALYREEKITEKRYHKHLGRKTVEDGYVLGAGLYIFEYIPFKVKRVAAGRSVYRYL